MCTDCFFILIGILFAGVSRTVLTALAIIIHSKRFFKSKQAKKLKCRLIIIRRHLLLLMVLPHWKH